MKTKIEEKKKELSSPSHPDLPDDFGSSTGYDNFETNKTDTGYEFEWGLDLNSYNDYESAEGDIDAFEQGSNVPMEDPILDELGEHIDLKKYDLNFEREVDRKGDEEDRRYSLKLKVNLKKK